MPSWARQGRRFRWARSAHVSLGVLFLLTSLTSCGKAKRIEGSVVSESGQPLEGVHVQVANSEFVATTNKEGRYSLDYVPGTIQIIYRQDGRLADTLSLTLAQKSYFPVSEVQLLATPSQPGVVWISPKGYVSLPAAGVRERVVQAGRTIFDREIHDFEPEGEPVAVETRKPRFLDTSPVGMFLVKLDGRHRMATVSYSTFGVNSKTDAEIVTETQRRRAESCLERTAELAPGDYAYVSFPSNTMIRKPGSPCYYFRVISDGAAPAAAIPRPAAGQVADAKAVPSYAGTWEWDGGEEGMATWVLRQTGRIVEGRYEWSDGSEVPRWAEVRGEVKSDGSITLAETKAGMGEKAESPSGRYAGHLDAAGAIIGKQSFTDSDWKNEWQLTRAAKQGTR